MRNAGALLVSLLAVGVLFAAPTKPAPVAPAPRVFATEPTHPDVALTEALVYLESKVAPDARPFVRFFWFAAVPDAYLPRVLTLWRTYLQMVSTAGAYVRPVIVDNTGGLLWAVDIRSARWTVDAFRAVAHRDLVFTEPFIDHRLAESLRRLIGVPQDPTTFHAEAIVPGAWFLREIMEVEGRSESYYDLLYAVERFGDDDHARASAPEPKEDDYWEPWPGGRWKGDAKYPAGEYPRGAFRMLTKERAAKYEADHRAWEQQKGKTGKANGFVDANFPRDFDDWARKWGIDVAEKFLEKERLFVKNGEVVAGSKDDPARGSYVAYQNRVVEFIPITTRAAGAVAMRTRDQLKTAAKGNLANQPREVALGLIEEDLGEHIVTMPNGFPADLLTGAAKAGRKRADFGDARAVHSSLDPRNVVIEVNYSCQVCHGPESGVIAPSNRKVRESLERATNLLAKHPDDRDAIEAFFVGWDANLEVWRLPLKVGLFATTATVAEPKGWTGARWAAEILAFRDWYDSPVTLDQAAAELGVPRLAVMLVALIEGEDTYDSTALFMGASVPRSVWDADLQPRLAKILAFVRLTDGTVATPYGFFLPELLSQAYEQSFERVKVKK